MDKKLKMGKKEMAVVVAVATVVRVPMVGAQKTIPINLL
jgi:hypothetical protein